MWSRPLVTRRDVEPSGTFRPLRSAGREAPLAPTRRHPAGYRNRPVLTEPNQVLVEVRSS